jgi:hypothetical protein
MLLAEGGLLHMFAARHLMHVIRCTFFAAHVCCALSAARCLLHAFLKVHCPLSAANCLSHNY